MFFRSGLAETTLGARYASEAPMSMVPFSASDMPVPDPVPAVWIVVFEYLVLYPPAHRLKRGYIKVLPVSVTVPPDGVSTPLFGSLTLAEAAELITIELNARPVTAAMITPRFSRAARCNFFTGSLLVRCWYVFWYCTWGCRERGTSQTGNCASPGAGGVSSPSAPSRNARCQGDGAW